MRNSYEHGDPETLEIFASADTGTPMMAARKPLIKYAVLSVLVCLAVAFPQTASAQSSPTGMLTLTWIPNSEGDVVGYKVFRRIAAEAYDFSAPLATVQRNVTTYDATGLTVGQEYFFVVTAFDASSNESNPSNEDSGIAIQGVITPDVVGDPQTSAESVITAAGLVVGSVITVNSLSPAGTVVAQDPSPGAIVRVGTVVDLEISNGPVAVPNVLGTPEAAALAVITAA